jgi:hypothetical protein
VCPPVKVSGPAANSAAGVRGWCVAAQIVIVWTAMLMSPRMPPKPPKPRPSGGRSTGTALAVVLALALVSCASAPDPSLTSPNQSPDPAGNRFAVPGAEPFWPTPPPDAAGAGTARPPTPTPTASTAKQQLPRGGTTLLPRYRLVGYSGGEASKAFGRLGVGNLDKRIDEMERTGRAYAKGGRKVLPVLELITVIVLATPGKDGKYRSRIDDAQIGRYLAAARRHKALLLLNIQPGRADFLPEVKGLQRWLAEPDVGIALDPEWAVGKNQTPGRVFGRTTAKELNAVAGYLSAFTRSRGLPEKAMVVHQLAPRIISRVQDVRAHKGVQVLLSVDGIGARADKESTWRKLVKPLPRAVGPGFKLFFEEDREHGPLMTPCQVLALKPTPDYVLYE